MEKNMLKEIESYCNKLLRIHEFADWTEAQNGLQVENSGQVNKIVAAVDVSCRTVRMAVFRSAAALEAVPPRTVLPLPPPVRHRTGALPPAGGNLPGKMLLIG